MRFNSDFTFALIAVGAITSSQAILAFSLPLLAFEISGEGTGLALIKGAGFIPNILFAIFIGVINDRLRKAVAFRRYSLGLTVSVAMLLGAAMTGLISITALMIFMIVFNALAYAIANAQMTLIRLTVPQNQLSDATGLTSMVYSTIDTIGPAIAGLMLVWLGHIGVIWGCLALLIITSLATLQLNPAEDLPPTQPFWPSLIEGWQVLRANSELMKMTVVIVLSNAAAGAFDVGLILKLKTVMLVSDFQIGIVLAFAGVGSIIAGRYAAPLRRRLGYRAAFFYPILLLAALYLTIILPLPFWAVCLLSFCDGMLAIFFAIGVWSYRQESTKAVHMGRVAGLTGAIFKIGMPPIIILAGVLSDQGSFGVVFTMAAGIMVFAALFLAYPARWGWPRFQMS